MRILLVSRWIAEEVRRLGPEGGTVLQLAEAVAAAGHEVVVLSQDAGVSEGAPVGRLGKLETFFTPRDRRTPEAWGMDKVLKLWSGHRKAWTDALALRAFLAQQEPFHFIWAQSEEPDGLVATLAQRLGPVPPVFTHIFALRYRFDRRGRPRFTHTGALGSVFRGSRLVAANSPLVAEAAVRHYGAPEKRLAVLPHNLTRDFLASFQDAAGADSLPAMEPGRILFLGALNEKKGATVFLEAYRRCSPQHPEWTFAMAGGFTEKNAAFELRWKKELARVRQATGNHLHILGRLGPEQVRREILRAAVVVLPSHYEEWSRALVEALALGRPVVATRTTGAAYLAEETGCGRVVPPGDPDALAQAMGDLAAGDAIPPERLKAAARRMREEFTPEATARKLLQMWEEKMGLR